MPRDIQIESLSIGSTARTCTCRIESLAMLTVYDATDAGPGAPEVCRMHAARRRTTARRAHRTMSERRWLIWYRLVVALSLSSPTTRFGWMCPRISRTHHISDVYRAPLTANAASFTASDSVGCECTVMPMSSDEPRYSNASTTSAAAPQRSAAMMWHPSSSSVVGVGDELHEALRLAHRARAAVRARTGTCRSCTRGPLPSPRAPRARTTRSPASVYTTAGIDL